MDQEAGTFARFDVGIGRQQQLLLNSLSKTHYIVEQLHQAIQENSKLVSIIT